MEKFFTITLAFLFFLLYLLAKNDNTLKNQLKILNAIEAYNLHHVMFARFGELDNIIDFDCMEDYNATFWRLWDWSCKRIVPAEIYAKIYPYIYKDK